MSRIEEFEKARPLLLSIAHRMLSSARQAEAAVHQAWLHYEASPEQPVSGRAFLTTALTDICLDALRRAHARQDRLARSAQLPPRREGDAAHSGAAALSLLQQLGPTERAVFILREVLHCTPAQTAAIVGCPEAACHRTAATAPGRATPRPSRPGRGASSAPTTSPGSSPPSSPHWTTSASPSPPSRSATTPARSSATGTAPS